MFWLNPEKVSKKIDGLIEQLESLGERISHHEQQFELAKQLGLANAGEDEHIKVWRRMQKQLIENLPAVKLKIRTGEEDYKDVNRALPVVNEQISFLRKDLDFADRSEAAGREAARKNLGI